MKRNPLSLREQAMNYLSRREHARAELKRKLLLKQLFSPDDIDAVLDQLAKENLQSDDRFVESYVRYRREQGFGPHRIAAELRERGIMDHQIDHYVNHQSSEWKKQLHVVWQKKFSTPPLDLKTQQQQFRFLYQRGFSSEEIGKLIKYDV